MNDKPLILLVDDDPAVLEAARCLLQEESGYECITAPDAVTALRLAEEMRPALIISDYSVAGKDAIELCRRVKSSLFLRNTMFMLLTAEQNVNRKVEALGLGADDYVSEPYTENELLSRVHALLRIKSLQDALQQERDELKNINYALEENLGGIINLLTKLISLRIPNASARGDNAAALCRWIGTRLGVEGDGIRALELAARLHEIGKIILSDGMIERYPRHLTAKEWKRFMEFPLLGQMIVQGIPQLESIGLWLRHQLENYDGTGYPDKLMEDEIPLESRILRAVNHVELTMEGNERGAENLDEALQRTRGTVLDPRVVQLLREYLQTNNEPQWLNGKQQISVFELMEGMTIASDIFTGSGTKLLPKDSKISRGHIERILAQHHFDPIINGIYIYRT